MENDNKDKKDDLEQRFAEFEKKITGLVTKAITKKKAEDTFAKSFEDLEKRLTAAIDKKFETVVEKEPTHVEKTFTEVSSKLKLIDDKIDSLRSIETSLRKSGEDYKAMTTRIAELEKQRKDLAETVVASVEKVVERKMGDMNKRLSEIENIPDLRSPTTESGVTRSFRQGFRAMLNQATGSEN